MFLVHHFTFWGFMFCYMSLLIIWFQQIFVKHSTNPDSDKQPNAWSKFNEFQGTFFYAFISLEKILSNENSLTFPIHESDNIVQSHFVFEFFSKCKCMIDHSSVFFATNFFLFFEAIFKELFLHSIRG